MKSQIVETRYYANPQYPDSNSVFNLFYKDEAELDVGHLIQSLEGFVVDTSMFRNCEGELIECLRREDYIQYYKIIKKALKKAIKSLKIQKATTSKGVIKR